MNVPEALRSILEIALRDTTLVELNERGILQLDIQVCLGDHGEYMWDTSSLFFTPKRHRKDLIPHG